MRADEAWFVAVVLVGTMLLALGLAEVLAQLLQPVNDALMEGTRQATQAGLS